MRMLVNVNGSSQFKNIEYQPLNELLIVTFKRKSEKWTYSGVPLIVFRELTQAESKGKYFHANIKKEYEAKKIS